MDGGIVTFICRESGVIWDDILSFTEVSSSSIAPSGDKPLPEAYPVIPVRDTFRALVAETAHPKLCQEREQPCQ